MRARVAGISSINSWKSIYYALKVSLAMVTSALKDITQHNHSPYINGNGSSRNAYHLIYYANGGGMNGAKSAAVAGNGVAAPTTVPVVTPNGAEIAQPSGIES
jgi:hypothetical protein